MVQPDDVPLTQVSNFTVCNNLPLNGNLRTDTEFTSIENAMSGTTNKGNVHSVAGSSAQRHTVISA